MRDYDFAPMFTVKDRNGESKKVTSFRQRILYPEAFTYISTVDEVNKDRFDVLAAKYYGSVEGIKLLIDANDKDIFDFDNGDSFFYPDSAFFVRG